MAKTATINTRIDPAVKKTAEAIFSKLGLSTSDAIDLFLNQVALHKGLPFEVKIPNKKTRTAIDNLQKKRNTRVYKSVDDLWKDAGL